MDKLKWNLELRTRAEASIWDLLSVMFIALKLAGYMDISWWWAISPSVLSIAVDILIAIIFVIVVASKDLS